MFLTEPAHPVCCKVGLRRTCDLPPNAVSARTAAQALGGSRVRPSDSLKEQSKISPRDDAPQAETGRTDAARSPAATTFRYNAFISYSHAADGKLAPALHLLHLFAKRWNRLRAVRVFRDEASLSANPALWGAIQQALSEAEFFILLASPEAARSEWVGREVAYWAQNKPHSNLLIALTWGELVWDGAKSDFDWQRTTACRPPFAARSERNPDGSTSAGRTPPSTFR